MATLDDRGLTIDRLPDILAKIRSGFEIEFAPILPSGQSLSFDDSSTIYRLVAPIAELIYSQEEALQQIRSGLDIATATGSDLEALCALGGVLRKNAQPANVLLMLYGVIGTTVASGSFVKSNVTNDVFFTLSDVLLDTTDVNGLEWQLTGIGTNHVVTLVWSSNENTNVPIPVNILSTDDLPTAQQKIVNAINGTTSQLTASITGNLVKVVLTDQNLTGSLSMTNATPVNSYKPVNADNNIVGKRPQDRLTINSIQTATLGWLGVTNPFDANEGINTESDEELRKSYQIRKLSDGNSQLANMTSSLLSLSGVRYLNIRENKLGVPVSGIPAHSFAVVILGGDDEAIAQAIVNNLPLGIGTSGSVSAFGFDANNNAVAVSFSRPALVPIQVRIQLSIEPNFPDNGAARIRQAIVDYIGTLQVGDDVLYSRLFTPINTVEGFSVTNLQISRVGGSLAKNNIVMQFNELATISFSDITFGG